MRSSVLFREYVDFCLGLISEQALVSFRFRLGLRLRCDGLRVARAATTAAVSVVATLTATSLFNYLVKIFKPVFMQAVKRIQKKLNGSSKTEEPSA